ncbi:SwmB domain-containing protein [Paenibacillus spongiae]|uniref:S-layer homology domain-containing protein n=1 Tax=Paenibacillus spongiae TaxID=2909671 RepID=A0ABY5SB05_9BACL|nr:SwmB domain-containing protein [Paenibacillus spongiae]UVI31131.1 S-layer homology domain-containing protein [Paenibacillus spongiae]
MLLRQLLRAISLQAAFMLLMVCIMPQNMAYALDDRKPMLQSSDISGAVIRLVYDEPLDENGVPDVNTMYVKTNNEAALIAGIQITGSIVYITLLNPPLPEQPVVLTYLPGDPAIRDISGNTAPSLIDHAITRPDSSPPLLVHAAADGTAVTLQYNEQLNPDSVPAPGSFVLKVNGISRSIVSTSVSGAALRLTMAEPIGTGQTVQVTYLHSIHPIQDLAGNDAANIYEAPVLNAAQAVPPEVTAAIVNGTQLQVTYNQSLNEASVPPVSSFNVTADSSHVAVSRVTISGSVLTLSLYSPVSASPSVKLDYNPPAVNALLGAAGVPVAAVSGLNVLNRSDVSPPQLTGARMNGAYVQLLYNEPLNASSVPGRSSFSVFVDGESRAVSSVAIADRTVSLLLESGPSLGVSSITVTYMVPANNGIQDSSGNLAGGLVRQPVDSGNDHTAPALISVLLESRTLILQYDEPLHSASVPSTGSFRAANGSGTIAVSSVQIAGNEVRLSLTGSWSGSLPITLSYTQPGVKPIQDVSGNAAASFSNWAVGSTADQTPPVLTAATVNKTVLKLTYSETLRANTVPSASQFQVTVGGYPRNVSNVSVNGTVVTLTLMSSAVAIHDAVKLTYTPPNVNPIQDLSGNKAAELSQQTVTNQTDATVPTLVSASINGMILTLVYSKALNPAYVPPVSSFSIYGSGYRAVTNVTVSGTMVTLILGTRADDSESLTVSYSQPYNGSALQDMNGNLAANLYSQQVRNGSDIMPPILTAAAVSGGQSTIVLTYNETLNSGSVPYASQYTVKSGDTTIPVSRVTISGTSVTLTLQSPIKSGQTITLSYTAGYSNSIKDKAGNQAASVSNYSVKMTNASLTVTGAKGDDRTVVLTFARMLDESSVPDVGSFTVTVNGSARKITDVYVDGYNVELTLSADLGSSANVRVSYKPGLTKLQDEDGAAAAAFTGRSVVMAKSSLESEDAAPIQQIDRNAGTWEEPEVMLAAGDARQTTETTAQGESIAVYTLEGSTIKSALQQRNGKQRKAVGFAALGSGLNASKAFKVRIPSSAFHSAPESAGADQFVVTTPLGAYRLPADVVDAEALSNQLKVPADDIYVGIVIRQADAALTQEMTAAALAGGLETLGGPIFYEVMVEGAGRTFPLQSFNQYIPRQLYIGQQITAQDTTIVWYDASMKRLAYVPNLLYTEGNRPSATIMHMTNGAYMAVKSSRQFTDMASHWAAADVQRLASKLIVSGVSAGAFGPNKAVTKAEFVTMLTRAMGLTGSGAAKELPYDDVPGQSWFRAAVMIAYENGIIDPAERFEPGMPITRSQMAVMAYRAVQAAGQKIPITNIDRSNIDKFTDLRTVSPEERNAIIADVKAGIMSGGSQTSFMPGANATRAQAAVILGRLLRYAGLIDG